MGPAVVANRRESENGPGRKLAMGESFPTPRLAPPPLMSGQNQQWTQNNGQAFTNYAMIQLPQTAAGMPHPITRDQYERNTQVIAQQDAFLRQHFDALARVRIQNELAYHGVQHVADRM
jgi:hypothetical protein